MSKEPIIHDVFETNTGTWQYIVGDKFTKKADIIDPVLNYDAATQTVTTVTADELLSRVQELGYSIDRILETHVHADHLTAAAYIQNRLTSLQGYRPPICIGARIVQVQELFGHRYGIPAEEYTGVFDRLFGDDEEFAVGKIKAQALHLPGHTPDHLGYKIGGQRFSHSENKIHQSDATNRQRILRRLPLPRRYWYRAVRLPGRKCERPFQVSS